MALAAAPPVAACPVNEPEYYLPRVELGEAAPEVHAVAVRNGGILEMAPGKVNVVYMFATWAAPSQPGLVMLETLNKKQRGAVPIIALAADNRDPKSTANVARFAKTNGPSLAVGMDPDQTNQLQYGYALPMAYVVDKHGRLRFALSPNAMSNLDADVKILTDEP